MKPALFDQVLTPDGKGLVCGIDYDSKKVDVCPKNGPQKTWSFAHILKIGNPVNPKLYFGYV